MNLTKGYLELAWNAGWKKDFENELNGIKPGRPGKNPIFRSLHKGAIAFGNRKLSASKEFNGYNLEVEFSERKFKADILKVLLIDNGPNQDEDKLNENILIALGETEKYFTEIMGNLSKKDVNQKDVKIEFEESFLQDCWEDCWSDLCRAEFNEKNYSLQRALLISARKIENDKYRKLSDYAKSIKTNNTNDFNNFVKKLFSKFNITKNNEILRLLFAKFDDKDKRILDFQGLTKKGLDDFLVNHGLKKKSSLA